TLAHLNKQVRLATSFDLSRSRRRLILRPDGCHGVARPTVVFERVSGGKASSPGSSPGRPARQKKSTGAGPHPASVRASTACVGAVGPSRPRGGCPRGRG